MTQRPEGDARSKAGMREDAKAEGCRLFACAVLEAGSGPTEVSRETGYTQAMINRWTDPESGRSVPLQFVWTAGKAGLVTLRRAAERVGYGIHALTEDAHGDNHIGRLHSILKECSDVTQVYSAAMSDGHLDNIERGQLLTEIREARAALEKAEASLAVQDVRARN